MKTCTKCGAKKRRNGFYTNSRTKDGLRSECKECSKETTRRIRARRQTKDLQDIAKNRDNRLIENIGEVMQMWQSLSIKMERVAKEAKQFQEEAA